MIYANNAATSYPMPSCVMDAMIRSMESAPVDSGRGLPGDGDALSSCRHALTRLIDAADPSRVIITSSATHALNYAIQGFVRMQETKAHCITTVLEHNSVLRPIEHLKQVGRVDVTYISSQDVLDARAFSEAICSDTRLVVVTACSNFNGSIPDLEGISRVCDDNGLCLIVDAAQAAGSISIDVSRLTRRIMIAFAGHKSLLGPRGTGMLYVGEEISPEMLSPVIQGGTGIRSDALEQPREFPLLFEAGTPNVPGAAGLAAGIEFVHDQGVDDLGAKKHELVKALISEVSSVGGISIYASPNGDYRGGVLSFNIEGWQPEELGYVLEHSFGITTRSGLHCAPKIHQELQLRDGTVRISVGYANTMDEMLEIGRAIHTLAGGLHL